jgi:hypothetical protein
LSAQRYQAIAKRYRRLTTRSERLAIDLNIVDRYQNVYPTKQQTGTELFQLVHQAASNFQRVALYFENSLLSPDLNLLPSAAAKVTRLERVGGKTVVESANGVGWPWKGSATVEVRKDAPGLRAMRLNAELRDARRVGANGVECSYESSARHRWA